MDPDLDSARSSLRHSEDEEAAISAPLTEPTRLGQAVSAAAGAEVAVAALATAAVGQQQSGQNRLYMILIAIMVLLVISIFTAGSAYLVYYLRKRREI